MDRGDAPRWAIPDWFLILVSGAIIVYGLWVGRDFFIPLAITALVFILTVAMVDWISARSIAGHSPPRWLANMIAASLIIFALFLLGVVFSQAGHEIVASGPQLRLRVAEMADHLESFLGPKLVDTFRNSAADLDIGGWFAAVIAQLAGSVSALALVSLYLVFLISERRAWIGKLPLLASDPVKARLVLARIATGVQQYMLVNALTSALSAGAAFLIFRSIGLDFAALLAVIVFIVGFIPNIGAFIGLALPCLIALIQFDTLTPFLIVLLGYGLFDQFVANIVQPAMQSRSLNVSTFMVMVSLTFFGMVWGGVGVFLAVPMMVVIMVICAEIPGMRWLAILLSGDGSVEQSERDH